MLSKRFIQLVVVGGVFGLLACAPIEEPVYLGSDGVGTLNPPVETAPDSSSTLFSEVRGR